MTENLRQEIEGLIKKSGMPPYMYADSSKFQKGKTPVLYSGQYWSSDELVGAIESLLAGHWISAGEKVKEFESRFTDVISDKYGIMVNSGSSANLVMLASLKEKFGWNSRSGIIVSPVGFPTTISAIEQNGLKSIFIDIEMDTLNFDVNLIEEKIKNYKGKTVGIFVSPVLGNPPDFDTLSHLCKKYDLKLILDCCDSLGSKWDNRYLNQYAIASSHSFYPAHTISTGEGGMITTNDAQLSKIARSYSSWGRACFCYGSESLLKDGACKKRFSGWLKNYDGIVDHKYIYDRVGYNLKPLDLQGAIGLAQLKKLQDIISFRSVSRMVMSQIFSSIEGVGFPKELPKAEVAWFGTPIVCETRDLKEALVKHLEENLIQTRNYFAGNLLFHKGFRHLGDWKEYPNSNQVLSKVFFVGASPHYNSQIFGYVKEVVERFNEKWKL